MSAAVAVSKNRVRIQCPACRNFRTVSKSAMHTPQYRQCGMLRCWNCRHKPGTGVESTAAPAPAPDRGNQEADRPVPETPTDADPGTPEKVAVLAERHARGEQLHHPKDRTRRISPAELIAWTETLTALVWKDE